MNENVQKSDEKFLRQSRLWSNSDFIDIYISQYKNAPSKII